MFSTTLGIKGTFDIAIARNLVRTQLATHCRISPMINTRVTIALTALGELIIGMQTAKAVPVKLQLLERDGHRYLEYCCSIPNASTENNSVQRYQVNLERVSHDFTARRNGKNLQIAGNIQLDAT